MTKLKLGRFLELHITKPSVLEVRALTLVLVFVLLAAMLSL
jgi:hypothetical protein